MALIVEDGSIVANANTYVSDQDYQNYANQRGLTIGSDSVAREAQLIRAMDYIEKHRAQFKGRKVSSTQSLQWPRNGVYIDNDPFAGDAIPTELKNAQIEAAVATANGVDLLPSQCKQNVSSESIGDLSVSYFYGGSWDDLQLDAVEAWLDPLLKNNGQCNRLVRV